MATFHRDLVCAITDSGALVVWSVMSGALVWEYASSPALRCSAFHQPSGRLYLVVGRRLKHICFRVNESSDIPADSVIASTI